MTHSPAQIIANFLVQLGLTTGPGGTAAWPCFYSREPDSPDNCVTVYSTQGVDHGRDQITGDTLGPDGIMLRIRSKDHATGWAKADAIRTALCNPAQAMNVTVAVGASRYLLQSFVGISNVLENGREPNTARTVWTINAEIFVKQTA